MYGLKKPIPALGLALICACVLHAQQQPVARCTPGSPRWEGKAEKLKIVLDNSTPPGDCRLSVSRGNKELFATQAKLLDVLAMGLDLNLDAKPDLAFQTGPAGDCCWTIHLLSLEKSPKLIGEISNRLPFVFRPGSTSEVRGFWTPDGTFADGFDGLAAGELTDLPGLLIRWDRAKPLYVGPSYRTQDQAADKLESQIKPDQVAAFRQSDGKLEGLGPELQPLRKTKALVLAVVLGHLTPGFEGSAWAKLEEFWPASDLPRIRKLLAQAMQTGLRSSLAPPPALVNAQCPWAPDVLIYRVGKGVVPPRPTHSPDPEYSEEARAKKYQGTVVLVALISADGCISKLQVQRSLGLGLDEKAIEAVRTWKFEPARKNGVPVAVLVNIEVNFKLY